jgi:hypothetical protein
MNVAPRTCRQQRKRRDDESLRENAMENTATTHPVSGSLKISRAKAHAMPNLFLQERAPLSFFRDPTDLLLIGELS